LLFLLSIILQGFFSYGRVRVSEEDGWGGRIRAPDILIRDQKLFSAVRISRRSAAAMLSRVESAVDGPFAAASTATARRLAVP